MLTNALLERFDPLQKELEELIANPEIAKQRFPHSSWMLSDVLASLKQLQGSLSQQPIDMEKCRRHAGGFGRLVMEYPDLPDSEFGDQLLGLASDIIRMAKGSSSNNAAQ